MEIKAVKFRRDGFYSQPFVFGGERLRVGASAGMEGPDKFDKNIRYRGSLQNITYVDEALYENKLSVVYDDLPDDWRCPRCKQPKEKFNKA